MPEVIEVEMYRRALEVTVGGRVVEVDVRAPSFVDDPDLVGVLVGERVTGTRRHGKLLLLDTTGPVLGMRFGMTGRLVVDGLAPIGQLAYGPVTADDGRWDRFVLRVRLPRRRRALEVRVSDPRRFGRVQLDPRDQRLGPDVWTCTADDVSQALGCRTAPVKAVLLDQGALAGLGNMLADELLWRTGIDPVRPARSLSSAELARLHAELAPMLDELFERGGSHAGDLSVEHRREGARCAIDGTVLSRRSIGGRTTWWCPQHQH